MSIERASPADLAQKACDVGPVPTLVGAVLVLDDADHLDPAAVLATVVDRLAGVPRLHQHLADVPFGCGRPVWVDDPAAADGSHVSTATCPGAGDEPALLELAADLMARPMANDRSPWHLTFVTGVSGGRAAMIVVFDHVLLDGIGGLAVVGELVDPPGDDPDAALGSVARAPRHPAPPPTTIELFVDAVRGRWQALRRIRTGVRRAREGLAELGPQAAVKSPRTSLQRPVGPSRHYGVARADLRAAKEAGRVHGATVNDVVVTAATGALARLLEQRAEPVDALVVSVPVSGRTSTTSTHLGNQVGVMPLAVPTRGTRDERLEQIATISRRHKHEVRGASSVLTTPVMRALGAVHLIGWFMDHQRTVTTFLTNLHGPDEQLRFLGAPVVDAVVASGIYGNVTVAFAVVSYAGALTVTVITDVDACPDAAALVDFLQQELDALTGASPGTDPVGALDDAAGSTRAPRG